jgi:mannose-binding lectin 1
MRFHGQKATSLIALLAYATASQAQSSGRVQDDLSFGQSGTVWTDDHREVTGFNLGGEAGWQPELLSDRIVMTPPWPGNKRASMWADHPEPNDDWLIQLNFRATGLEHAGGNLNIWHVKDKNQIGTASIKTVGKFEGLAIVIDQYGGNGVGSVRGFLNDGSISYKDHHNVDILPFGHCDFAYRNTGKFLMLEVRQSQKDFEVIVEGKSCFKTHKVCISTITLLLTC